MEPNNNFPPPATSDNGKTAGIISYFTIFGWLIAFFAMHQNNKTALGSYQLRQTLLLHIVSLVVSWLFGIIFTAVFFSSGLLGLGLVSTLIWAVRVVFIILWLVGLIGAVNGEMKPIPVIGERAQTMFPGI